MIRLCGGVVDVICLDQTHNTRITSLGFGLSTHLQPNELTVYLENAAGPMPLMLDLHIAHDRFGSSSDPSTIITILRTQSPLCLLFLVRLGGYIVNSLDCYSD